MTQGGAPCTAPHVGAAVAGCPDASASLLLTVDLGDQVAVRLLLERKELPTQLVPLLMAHLLARTTRRSGGSEALVRSLLERPEVRVRHLEQAARSGRLTPSLAAGVLEHEEAGTSLVPIIAWASRWDSSAERAVLADAVSKVVGAYGRAAVLLAPAFEVEEEFRSRLQALLRDPALLEAFLVLAPEWTGEPSEVLGCVEAVLA